MAENKSNSTPETKENVCCMNCKHRRLIRYGNNPILAECYKKPQAGNIKFPYERMIAKSQVCSKWERCLSADAMNIQQMNDNNTL